MIDLEKQISELKSTFADICNGIAKDILIKNKEIKSLEDENKMLREEIGRKVSEIKGLKDLNIELQYSKQRVKVELSDLDGEFILIKQKLKKFESGELVVVPREPTKEMLDAGFSCGYGSSTREPYKAMVEVGEVK